MTHPRCWNELASHTASSPRVSPPVVRGPILLVDDDPDLRELMSELLSRQGYAVVTAADGTEALRYLSSGGHPSLIILDLMMPGMDGWEFRARQRADAALAHIPVVILSGVHDIESRAKELAAVDVLPKPIDVARLQRTLQTHCMT